MATPDRRAMLARAAAVMVFLAALSSIVALQAEPEPQRMASLMAIEYSATIHVNVTDDVGRPVEGAVVRMASNSTTWLSNETGVAIITGLGADNTTEVSYTIWAERTGYEPSPNQVVVVIPQTTSYASLVLGGGVILGTVQDGSASPISGATVSISALGYSNMTGSDGTYRLEGIPGGTHSVNASANGFVSQTKDVVLGTGGVSVLDFTLISRTGAISGIVVHATTSELLEGANVSVRVGEIIIIATTDENGAYRIPNLPSGTYALSATLEGFNTSVYSNVVVTSGVETTNINFQLEEKPTRLFGVVKAGALLLPGVHIDVVGTNYSANSTIEGEYEIKNIPAGTYTINATLEGFNVTTLTGVVIPRGSEKQQNIIMVGQPGALQGAVYDSTNPSQPLSGVTVTIVNYEPNPRSTITNINGEFTFTGLTEGNYTVSFEYEGYKPREIGQVVITQEGTARLDQVLLEPKREMFGGFFLGFDLAHSMMILALFLTIIILAIAVILRIRTFESPEESPAVYDEAESEEEEQEKKEEEGKLEEGE